MTAAQTAATWRPTNLGAAALAGADGLVGAPAGGPPTAPSAYPGSYPLPYP